MSRDVETTIGFDFQPRLRQPWGRVAAERQLSVHDEPLAEERMGALPLVMPPFFPNIHHSIKPSTT